MPSWFKTSERSSLWTTGQLTSWNPITFQIMWHLLTIGCNWLQLVGTENVVLVKRVLFETWDWERQTVESSWRLFQHKEKETHFFLAFSVVLSGSDILRNISLLLDNQLHCCGFIILTTKWSFNRNWRVEGWIGGKLAKKVRSCSQRGSGEVVVGGWGTLWVFDSI